MITDGPKESQIAQPRKLHAENEETYRRILKFMEKVSQEKRRSSKALKVQCTDTLYWTVIRNPNGKGVHG